MNAARSLSKIKRLIEQADALAGRDSDDPEFKTWKNGVERTLISAFGRDSTEFDQFQRLKFFYNPGIWVGGVDYSADHRKAFEQDLKVLVESLRDYAADLEEDGGVTGEIYGEVPDDSVQRVFISHASADADIVEELVDLLEILGLSRDSIFSTSLPGYGIDLGENYLDALKDELTRNTLVLFVLSEKYYQSPVCLCEMGGAWILTKDHVPIVVPPFGFDDIKGVIPVTQGIKINDAMDLNLLREKLEKIFGDRGDIAPATWERKRDRVVQRVNAIIEATKGGG